MARDQKTIFQKIIDRELPAKVIYESDAVIVINNIKPVAPVHYLIIPKKPLVDMKDTGLNKELSWELIQTVQYLAAQLPEPVSFNLISNNGAEAGQSVFHMHWHFISGKNIYETSGLEL